MDEADSALEKVMAKHNGMPKGAPPTSAALRALFLEHKEKGFIFFIFNPIYYF